MGTASPSGMSRPYRLPAVEVAATRNILPIVAQRRMQRVFFLVLSVGIFGCAYAFARVPWPVLLLTMAAGFVLAAAITRLRNFGAWYSLVEKVRAELHPDDEAYARAMRVATRHESRTVAWRMAAAALLVPAAVGWAALSHGRWWVVALCVLALGYARSSVRALGPPSAAFTGMTGAAGASGCRIGLFRPFREDSSALARNALLPILEGYGTVEVVGDPTFDRAAADGVYRVEYGEGAPGQPHRFANEEWQERVRAIIEASDVAVLDISAVSPGIVWEVAQCYRALPDYRVMLVLNQAALAGRSLADYIREFYALLGQHPEMPRDINPYVFLFSPGAGQEEALAVDVHRKMCEIVQRDAPAA